MLARKLLHRILTTGGKRLNTKVTKEELGLLVDALNDAATCMGRYLSGKRNKDDMFEWMKKYWGVNLDEFRNS